MASDIINAIIHIDKNTLALFLGYLCYLFTALFRYLVIVKQVLQHNISLGLPIEFSFGWKGVKISAIIKEKNKSSEGKA